MGATSNDAKQRWNSSRYAQVKVSVRPELAEAFKAKCKAENVSIASEISRFMTMETCGRAAKTPLQDPYSTRAKRRKELNGLIGKLEAIMESEQSYMENIPENLQTSRYYEAAEQSVSALEEALDILAEAY